MEEGVRGFGERQAGSLGGTGVTPLLPPHFGDGVMGMNMPELDRIYLGDSAALLEASRLNRKFIGIDINKDYVKMAEKRIAPELSQSKLF